MGQHIRWARKCKKMTQDQVVSQLQLAGCDLSRGTYAKIEAGIRHVSLEELQALSRLLDADYNTLLGYTKP